MPAQRGRTLAGAAAAVATVAVLVPPVITGEVRHGYLEALQFAVLGLIVPPLVVVAAPQRRLPGLAATLGRLAETRRRHLSGYRSLAFVVAEVAVLVVWRVPAVVDAVAADRALVALELVSLLAVGVAFSLEFLDSPPHTPRLAAGPVRAGLQAITMWSVWIVAYLGGFSHGWYPRYRVLEGASGAASDQQVAAGLLWFFATVVFVPRIFADLRRWLEDEEHPEAELQQLVREERRRAGA